jgi:hypothetical protein
MEQECQECISFVTAAETGGNCEAEWKTYTADDCGGGYGANEEIRKKEVSGLCCWMLLFYVLNSGEFLCIIKP